MFRPDWLCCRLNNGCCLEKRARAAPLITTSRTAVIISSSKVNPRELFFLIASVAISAISATAQTQNKFVFHGEAVLTMLI